MKWTRNRIVINYKNMKKLSRKTGRKDPRSNPGVSLSGELGKLVGEAEKAYGAGVINFGKKVIPWKSYLPSGVFVVDYALLGGFPESSVIQFSGPESSGKSTMAVLLMRSAQKKYPSSIPVYVDLEGSFDPKWAENLGLNMDQFLYVNPKHGEEAVDFTLSVLKARESSLVVFDSLPAIVPVAGQERSSLDRAMCEQAILIGELIKRSINTIINESKRGHKITLVAINQYRDNVGVFYGSKIKLPGGWWTKHGPTVTVDFLNKEAVDKSTGEILCNEHKFKITKCKSGCCVKNGEFKINRQPNHPFLGIGHVDELDTVRTFCRSMGIVTGSGSSWTFSLGDVEHKFSKLDEFNQYIREQPDLLDLLKASIVVRKRMEYQLNPFPQDGYIYGVDSDDLDLA